jgi:DNA-binding winged helix-turn-helix (wHTH) protein
LNTLKDAGLPRIGFEGFLYDEAARQLRCGKIALELTRKAFDLLGLLLKNRPRALSKAELRDALWPKTFVSDSSLAQVVTELRSVLGDDARAPRLIRTVYGFGYAFAGSATATSVSGGPSSSLACASLVWGPNEVALHEGENVIGRDPGCRVRVNSPRVSRRHARLTLAGPKATLEDLGSKNGTYREGRLVEGALRLSDGDEIIVGPAVFVFRASAVTGTTKTASRALRHESRNTR